MTEITISVLIAQLQKIKAAHGDLFVTVYDKESDVNHFSISIKWRWRWHLYNKVERKLEYRPNSAKWQGVNFFLRQLEENSQIN